MRRTTATLILFGLLGGFTGLAAAQPAVRPAFHDGALKAWGEVANRLMDLARDLECHVTGCPGGAGWLGLRPSPRQRPLSWMLDHREELALTREQVSRLEGLRTDFTREAIRREADIRIAELDLSALLAEDPLDMRAVEAQIRRVARLRAELRVARLRTIEAGKAVLTAEQRARLGELVGTRQSPRRTAGRAIRF